MVDCIFCKIVNKEIPAEIVFENDNILVFKDISPKAPVHLLFIPKKHIASVNELKEQDKNLISEIFLQAKQIAAQSGISESGYRMIVNTGPDSGQEVFHIHFHLIGGKSIKSLI